jgi:CRISPR-associated endonuclease/helicase Cas3
MSGAALKPVVPGPPQDAVFYAHTLEGESSEHWELLPIHLAAVADRAEAFASRFGLGAWGRVAGHWHDLGKYSLAFQNRVLRAGIDEALDGDVHLPGPGRVDHSTAGAQYAARLLPKPVGDLIAYVIAGHHGHLPDFNGDGSDSILQKRLAKAIEPIDPPARLLAVPDRAELQPIGWRPASHAAHRPFQFAFLTRMLFSALVDADWLETERFCDGVRAAQRRQQQPDLKVLLSRLDDYIMSLTSKRRSAPAPVDRHRQQVLGNCRAKASHAPGWFSLTVPTGGGKTLASLAFALTHGHAQKLERVIYALPFTSIIEQNASIFRAALGDDVVLEHHSNLDPDATRSTATELATENWDSTVVVTTNVQLFESLFASQKTRCRKVHRIAGSVIVLDEAQTMPPELLAPCLAALDELVRNYRCTVVLCTATQPAITHRDEFPIGIEHITEIVEAPTDLFHQMKRVNVHHLGPLGDEELVERLASTPIALCIVNTKRLARELAQQLGDRRDDVVHLSAAMCPAHRTVVINDVRDRLASGRPCLVVSTQVIEAGVDVDFPVVYRELAGFDSIAQAAGRCNREGRRATGDVYVFESSHRPPPSLRSAMDSARQLVPDHPDPLTLDAIEAYFRHHYWRRKNGAGKPWDDRDVMSCFQGVTTHQFRTAAERFRWIGNETHSIVVPYGDKGRQIVELLSRDEPPDWRLTRRCQRYTVSVYEHDLQKLAGNTTVTLRHERFWVLTNPAAYDDRFGLLTDVAGWDPDGLIG